MYKAATQPGQPRRLREQAHLSPTEASIDGRRAVLFSGNDYLGLASDPEVVEAAAGALAQYGCSARGARLISGNHELYGRLEAALAAFKNREAALVFPTGYTANLGALSTLAGPDDQLFMDKLNHASLYDGCRQSGAKLHRYRHLDMAALERRLSGAAKKGSRFIVTDGVFSMDGDIAPLHALSELANAYEAGLIVDDAHATGVLGPQGRGSTAGLNILPDLEIGTLSKALGNVGGFVVGDRRIIDRLINYSRPFIFTTGLPPAVLAGSLQALEICQRDEWRRRLVLARAKTIRRALGQAGFKIGSGATPIIPIVVGAEKTALDLSRKCLERGVFIPAIRTPSVPKNQARLRLTVSSAHTDGQVNQLIEIVTAAGKEVGVI